MKGFDSRSPNAEKVPKGPPEHMTGQEEGYISPTQNEYQRRIDEISQETLGNSELSESEREVREELLVMANTLMAEARSDMLTGLPNRRALQIELTRIEDQLKRLNYRNQDNQVETPNFALVAFDLDGFKQLNDTFGHEAGDVCLKIASQKIKEQLRPEDFFAREGGDEFIIVLSNTDLAGAKKVGENILNVLKQVTAELRTKYVASKGEDEDINISASVGVASRAPAETGEQWLKDADYTRYVVKAAGKDAVTTFAEAREMDNDGAIYRRFRDGKPPLEAGE